MAKCELTDAARTAEVCSFWLKNGKKGGLKEEEIKAAIVADRVIFTFAPK